jgi:hypothetical protein
MRTFFYRFFVSMIVVSYLAVSFAGFYRDTAWGRSTYSELRWLPRSLSMWQNWGMFAPPPSSTSWILMEGTTLAGETIALDPLFPELEEGFFRWRYDRLQKLVLSSVKKSRKALRKGIGTYYCEQSAQSGVPLKTVTLYRDRKWALRPSERLKKNPKKPKHKKTEMETVKCQPVN